MEIDSILECVGLIELYSQTLNQGLLFNFHSTLHINIESTLGKFAIIDAPMFNQSLFLNLESCFIILL